MLASLSEKTAEINMDHDLEYISNTRSNVHESTECVLKHSASQLSSELQENAQRLLQSIQKDLNLLIDPSFDRSTKILTLKRLAKDVMDPILLTKNSLYVDIILFGICSFLTKLLADPIEKCREIAALYFYKMLSQVPDVRPYLVTMLPILNNRLANEKTTEPSEEVRLCLIQLLHLTIQNLNEQCSLIAPDAWNIIECRLSDTFPIIRKESCAITVLLMSLAPEKSRTSVEKIVNTLVKSLSHRHASVRVAAVQAIGECYFVDTSSFKETWPSIKKLLLDDQSLVRYQIYTLARDWQLRLIDRYSYAMYMLFFLLHGLREEIDDLRFVCESALPMISELYEKDWESRLKDQLNYNPNKDKLIGFRELVRENMLALTDFIVEDLYHWTVEVRHCAAKVLSGLVLYAREHISGYLGKLFPALHRVVHDPFQTLILEITEEIGSFISPELLLHLLLPSIKNTSTLILITSALQKSNCTEFHVNKLLESLAQNFESDVSQSELLTPLFLTILSKSNSLSPDGLHRRLIFILGVQLNEPTVLTAIEASPLSIFEESKPCLLSLPLAELQTSRHHPTFLLFKKMLLNCPPSFFDKDLLPPLMQLSDVNMLLEILPVLLKRSNLFSFEFCSLLWPFLILHLKWNGGKLFFQLRELVAELAVLCINQDSLSIILDPLTDALTSAMDDERLITRKHYLSLTEQVLLSQSLTSEHLKKLYCEILKRLDDASDEIRVQACHLIQSIFLRCSIVNSLDHIHIDEIIKKITIHIDDQNPMIQNAAASTLLSINALYPDLVKVHLASVKQYFRNQSMIQQYF